MYQPDENKTLLKGSMLQCLFSHIGNFHRTHTENRGVELIGDRVFKAARNTLYSVRHTEHRAYGCAVNAVFNVRNTCVTPRHICRKLRIAGIYISEVISSYLCSDPLPVRIYIYCRIRRFKPFNIIAKRNSLGCDSSVTAKRKSQAEYTCKKQTTCRHARQIAKSSCFLLAKCAKHISKNAKTFLCCCFNIELGYKDKHIFLPRELSANSALCFYKLSNLFLMVFIDCFRLHVTKILQNSPRQSIQLNYLLQGALL